MPAQKVNWNPLAKRLGYDDEREMLVDLYKLLGGLKEVSSKLGYSTFAVRKRMRLYGIPLQRPGRKHGFILDKESYKP